MVQTLQCNLKKKFKCYRINRYIFGFFFLKEKKKERTLINNKKIKMNS